MSNTDLRPYQYGSDPIHKLYLTDEEAWVVNNIRFTPVDGTDYYVVNLTGERLAVYDRASEILNAYMEEVGPVDWDPETHPDVLTPTV